MATLQTSGQISIGNLRSHFGDSGDSRMSEFYRGGGRVPATRTVPITVREPATGESYDVSNTGSNRFWETGGVADPFDQPRLVWNQVLIANVAPTTSYTIGSVTYFRGTLREIRTETYGPGGCQGFCTTESYWYAVYRTYPSTRTDQINTGIPTSGQIALSQFYGAANS